MIKRFLFEAIVGREGLFAITLFGDLGLAVIGLLGLRPFFLPLENYRLNDRQW